MAKKELWTDEVLLAEFTDAFNYLDTIPKRYLKNVSRAMHLFIHTQRLAMQNVEDMREHAKIQGGIYAIASILARIDAIIAGTDTRIDVDAQIEQMRKVQNARADYRETFGPREGDDEYFDGSL